MAKKVYDKEQFLDDIKDLLVEKLEDKLSELESRKNDGITLPRIPEKAYFFQSLDERIANFKQFILYGTGLPGQSGDEPAPIFFEMLTAEINILFVDGGSNNLTRIALRYQQALKEIFKEHWHLKSNSIKIKISDLNPIDLTTLNGSEYYKAVGIRLEGSLA